MVDTPAECSHQSPQRSPEHLPPSVRMGLPGPHWGGQAGQLGPRFLLQRRVPGAEAAMPLKWPRNRWEPPARQCGGSGGGCKAGGPGTTPVTPTLFSLHRLDNVHGSRVEPSETARMNSMDRHIQQTNDRLQCIKQVGVCPAYSSAGADSRGAGCPVAVPRGPGWR